jgi:hypothetical protein
VEVNVNYPDVDSTYNKGYNDGYAAGRTSVKGTTTASTAKTTSIKGSTKTASTARSTGTGNVSTTSPKTGASLPALPILAVFAFTGLLVCGKKAQNP